MYKKRDGTSGIRGQLYETKLISLIHFRTIFDDNIEGYNLATNVADIGTFDDICIRATVKTKGGKKPVAVFIQAKHREGDKVQLTLNSKNDLAKWFSSYLSISRLFKPNNKDVLFKGKFEDIECLFIMYTTAKADHNTIEYKSDFANKLNGMIGTGDKGLRPCHKEEDIVFLCEIIMKEQFAALAVQMAKFLSDYNTGDNSPIMSMNDDLVLLYHVILELYVLDVSEIKNKHEDDEHRVASFKKSFFDNDNEFIILFRNTLSIEMLKNRKLNKLELDSLLSKLFIKPLDISVLIELIGNVVTFDEKKMKLEFVSKMPDELKRHLEKVDVLQSTVDEAIELAAKNMLTSRRFKVPAAFGNKDLTIRGKEEDVEPSTFIASVVDSLRNKFVELINASPPGNIIVLDESLGKEFLQLNAGLAGTIGNILVPDVNSKFLKFTDNSELLEKHAKRLYDELHSAIPNLVNYRFHINIKTFPKLTFECDDNEDFEILKQQVTVLAENMGKFVCKKDDSIMTMNGNLLRYHVLVAQKAVELSEIQSLNEDDEHRLARFRQNFFENDDTFVVVFKEALCCEILKLKKLDEDKTEVAKEILSSVQFKVPASFGNKDLAIKIKKSKTEKRLDHLKLKLSALIANSNEDKIVTFDETLEDGLLRLNGGLAGSVGNILVAEENTKLMKFTDNWESLGDLSKRLFVKLQNGIENLHKYRFDVKVKKFPKLSFKRDEDDENKANDFLEKLLFFTNQADEKGVEKFLKDEIEYHQCLDVNNVRVTADAIFLQYHDTIQKWWMLKEASYLTKKSKHYENAIKLILDRPLLTTISKMFMIKIKNNIGYTFNEKALNSLNILEQPSATFVVTESSALTVAKMVQSLKNTEHFVFDLEYILDLPAKDLDTVKTELSKTAEDKVIIVVCNNVNRSWFKKLESIAKVLENKRTIFVTNENSVEAMKTYFLHANNVVMDAKCSLIQMSKESQNAILQNAKVRFQDIELKLDGIIDEASMAFVEGEVLSKVMNNELIVLGKSNSNLNYEKVKHLYIDRRVIRRIHVNPSRLLRETSRVSRSSRIAGTVLQTLNDITDVALVTAKPGMGKSTLLTHLSLKTKELYPKVWIVTINLLIHSEKFSKWRDNKTNIDYLETLKFFCEVLSEKQNKTNDLSIELEVVDDEVRLKSCTGDQWTVFELNMFLDYYNRKELMFLFDGFDEICPMYTDEVLSLLKTVRRYPSKHKMWITSRSYDNVIARLENAFGESYEIQHFSESEEDSYLLKYWKSEIKLREFTNVQFNNLCSFMEFISLYYNNQQPKVKNEKHQILFIRVCRNFLIQYLKKEIHHCPESVVQSFNALFTDCNYTVRSILEDFDTPLHLYLIAEYFQNQIKDENVLPNRWNVDINAFTVYDTFIETKLKKIRFQEKNKIDLFNPDNMIIYENVRTLFFAKHYKLGAYAIFHEDADKIFSVKELIEIKETIDKIREGTEKTGLIHSVVNGVPNFIHMTFTEYFAVQYICNLLKTETREDKIKSLWDFILNVVFLKCRENLRTVLGYKIKTDEVLRSKVSQHGEIIFDLLYGQGKGVFTHYADDFSKYLYSKVKTSLLKAMDEELSNFMPILYNLKQELSTDYLDDPTRTTPRIKRLKFYHLLNKKRKILVSGHRLEINEEGTSSSPIAIPTIDQYAGLYYSYRGYNSTHSTDDDPGIAFRALSSVLNYKV